MPICYGVELFYGTLRIVLSRIKLQQIHVWTAFSEFQNCSRFLVFSQFLNILS